MGVLIIVVIVVTMSIDAISGRDPAQDHGEGRRLVTWTGPADAPPTARIAALAPSLQPSERRVAEAIAADVAGAVE